MIKRYSYLFLIFSLTVLSLKSEIPDSLINIIDAKEFHFEGMVINNNTSESKLSVVDQKWIFINEDKSKFRFGLKDEINYLVVNSHSGIVIGASKEKGIFDTDFNGVGWYNCYFKMPAKQINKVYDLEFALHGAVEIYLDGILQKKIGEVSINPNEAEELNVTDGSLYFPISDTAVHCIAIRFGLLNYKDYLRKYPNSLREPYFQFSMPETKDNSRSVLSIYYSITNMLSAFFFSLFIIHFLIYIFYREQTFNLLYSLFLILLSLTFLENYIVRFIQNLNFYLWLDNIDDVIFPTVCFILVTLLNRLLNEKRSWHYVLFSFVLVYHYIDVIFIGSLNDYTEITIIFYTYFNTLAHSIKGVRRKVASAKFLGWGILCTTISLVLLILVTLIISVVSFKANNENWVLFIYSFLIVISILSIPTSMSAYLAYDFASTNRSLSNKLVEVEELSIKNIEQEKEKQKILAGQNERLERQVEERTKEINEQKKEIEEKNKDITDSINYAQRIQRSILPTENEINEIFKECFVLFKPRDIVSGDFYQFKKSGDYNYAIMADCTGHGVPGALMSMIGSNLLKQIILERGTREPNKILSELHREVRSTLRQTSGVQSHDGMDASILLEYQNKLYISSANRPVYIIYNDELIELKPDKFSIGGSHSNDDLSFKVSEVNIVPGMMIYMFSDGYADQFGGEAGKKFKVKNLSQLLLSNYNKPLLTQKEILNTTFDNWKNDLEQVDDVCIIGIKF